MTRPVVALAVGGTAGHVYPAVAVAEELEAAGCEAVFFGAKQSIARSIVEHSSHRFLDVAGVPFERTGAFGKLAALAVLPVGWIEARAHLRRGRVEAIVGFGGYPTVAAVLAARSVRIWTAIHEANARLGRANGLLAPRVDRVFTALDGAVRSASVVGVPVRRAIRGVASRERHPPAGPPTVLVMSGTEPAPFLNSRVPPLLGRLRQPLRVIHQTAGEHDEDVRARYTAAGIEAEVAPYFEAMEEVYARADLAITRAGASSVAELALCGIPSILVPNPAVAADHQTENVRSLEAASGVTWFAEEGWDECRVAEAVASLFTAPGWADASRRIHALARPDAAERMARAILAAVGR